MDQATMDPTPAATGAPTPDTGTASVSTGTVTPSGQASTGNGESAPAEESFTSVDPNRLPPELKAAYNNMLTDYKKKTAEVAARRRDYDSLSKKAGLYDQISSDEAFVRYWNGLSDTQKKEAVSEASGDGQVQITEAEFAQAFESPQNFQAFVNKLADQKMQGLSQKTQSLEQELVVTKASEFVKDFKMRPEYKDFDKFDKYGFITYQIQANPPSKADPRAWESALKSAYKNAEQVYGDIFEEGRKNGLTRIEEKARLSTESPSNSLAGSYSGGDPKSLSVAEAVALARKGIKVPKN